MPPSAPAPLNNLSPLAALPAIGAAASGATDATTAAPVTTGPDWLTGTVAQITVIVLGLILIVAGLFQFKGVREVAEVATV